VSFLDRSLFSDFFSGLFTLALAFALAVSAVFHVAGAGAGLQQLLGPGNDLVTVGGDYIDSTDNSGQRSQNFHNGVDSLHLGFLHFSIFPLSV
jgi:hypothetical protein